MVQVYDLAHARRIDPSPPGVNRQAPVAVRQPEGVELGYIPADAARRRDPEKDAAVAQERTLTFAAKHFVA
ncbi:hypothetical protein GCM10011504_39080 [Siccirubricoccus deserti]|nr:hypothetical protein GCM10011504_39080 [Siccirubricoccus deserti]